MFVTRIRADAVDDRSPWGDFWFEPVSVRSSSGMRVSGDAAMRLTAVYACVRVLAETMASLPFCLYRPKQGGGRELVTDHWLYRLLAKAPNRWQDRFQWREMMQGHLVLRGNAYNRIIPDNRGGIAELRPLHPDRVSIELLDSGRYRYRLKRPGGDDEILPAEAVFKLTGLSSNGLIGLNPIEIARESIGEGLAQQDYGARFFANDARPMGGWLEYPGKFGTDDARRLFRESWQKGQAGENRGKTAVLEGGIKYHEIGLSNSDSQFVEGRKLKITDIARIFRIPPHMIADLDRSTNNNIEWQSMEFVRYTMLPWAERWEAGIENQLLGDEDGLDIDFDFDNLQRGDSKSRGEFYNLGVTGGWMTRNEIREKEGLNPLDGLSKPLQPLNMAEPGQEPAPQPGAPADDNARAAALTLAIAGRVVRKETAALRRAHTKSGGNLQAFRAAVDEFYSQHADYVVASLLCPEEAAAAWCDRQAEELHAATDSAEGEINFAEGAPIVVLLDAWDASAAAELAARVTPNKA